MSRRTFALHPAAQQDLLDTWSLVQRNDGDQRANKVTARIEAFIRSLPDFPYIGRMYDSRRVGLRSTSVPGLNTVTVIFRLTDDSITVLRIGYLGRNVMARIPESAESL